MAKIDEHIKVMMLKGETGASIKSIGKTATSGLVDTYTVTLTDGSKSNFTVTNGKNGTNGKDGKDGADFDTFEIGGRNLLLKSRTFGDYKGTSRVTLSDGVLSFGTAGNISDAILVQCCQSALAFLRGQKVTISYWVRVRESLAEVAYNKYWCEQLVAEYIDGTDDYFGILPSLESETATPDSKWRKVHATYQLKDIEVKNLTVNFYKRGITGAVDFTLPKLEVGTKPSDWTPAPEDKADVSALAGKADVSVTIPKASVESSATASQAYAGGDYVVVNGLLRKVKAAIAKGDTISDSNSTATTVTGELATIGKSVSQSVYLLLYSEENGGKVVFYARGGMATLTVAHVTGVNVGTPLKLTTDTIPKEFRPDIGFYSPLAHRQSNNIGQIWVPAKIDDDPYVYLYASVNSSGLEGSLYGTVSWIYTEPDDLEENLLVPASR